MILSHGESNARGVAVCIKKNSQLLIQNIEICQAGRYIIFDVEENGEIITCAGIYAPNKDDPSFFKSIEKTLEKRHENKLIIGDFNTTLDVEKDRKNTYNNNEKTKEEIINIMDHFSLKEIWRERFPDKLEYSWFKRGNILKASRIDYALISAGIDQKVENCTYVGATHTDHRALLVVIDLNYVERGKGFWKFNNLLLSDKNYVTLMNQKLSTHINSGTDNINTWENLKKMIKRETKKYTRNKVSDNKLIIAQLTEKRNIMLESLPLNKEEDNILEQTTQELEEKTRRKNKRNYVQK